ncbi:MAG: bifunctional [glutamate--ammonia ligase]-adenylyl-L-tyrosine phosphorylase/[glutamate--ammonia-ligase] adenylyltransferase [Deltaproteobacteria bacterium]|nr:MAG: bifunctional [glutamate--ammonia ligase]-adenylyl-L-tyrosine phosphorylase/[glutamate--ammonia-ligase] adenylyltransferase [Deltaproteobacteria bacterium]
MSREKIRKEAESLFEGEIRDVLDSCLERVPDGELFCTNLVTLAESVGRDEVASVLSDSRKRKALVPVLAASPYLTGLMAGNPEIFNHVFREGGVWSPPSKETLIDEVLDALAPLEEESEVKRILRRMRNREMVRIGVRDLAGLAEVEETTRALSDLADACLEGAVSFAIREMKKRYGTPICREGAEEKECGFVVIGLGKLGGEELNFSSDIDLMFVYESDRGGTTGIASPDGEKRGEVTNHQFFVKVSEFVSRLISEVTEDGFVFRVDHRLRPDGARGPLANSLRSLEIYYESWGQTWERMALLKARPVAGDADLGRRFEKTLQPFVYRKYLDFIAIEEIKELKERIDLSQKLRSGKLWDVKLGKGGIREIEFFVQVHQIIFGGKNPSLRVRGTLPALALLRAERFISPGEEESLREAYRFFRNLEHRVQMLYGSQTQELPSGRDLELVAFLMGFEKGEELLEEVERQRKKVEEQFGKLFAREKARKEVDVSPEVISLLYGEVPPEEEERLLSGLGFRDVKRGRGHLVFLREGPQPSRLSDRARKYLREIAPLILWEAARTPFPDRAMENVESFFQSVGARTSYYAFFAENPKVISPLVQLFGSSQFLSRFLISHPELVDILLRQDQSEIVKSRTDMRRELGERLVRAEDFEEELAILRTYRNEEFLRIGIHRLGGNLSLEEFSHQLSSLAEVLMGYALFYARREVEKRFGKPGTFRDGDLEREAQFCVLGLGKLGGEELNFHSDLDVLFVYSHLGEGEKLTNSEYFAKVAQRFISILSTVTKEGYVYKVDMRLRPSGSAGPLVVSREAFENYYLKSAWLFERQALIKARFVAGDRELGKSLEKWISWFVYERPLPEGIKEEIRRLRKRMEGELGRERGHVHNIKYGRGGIVDVEFLVQYLQLLHGREFPAVRSQNTLKALYELYRAGILTEEEFTILDEGFRFLRELEISMRLVHDAPVERLTPDDMSVKLLKFRSVEEFEEMYDRVTEAVRRVYDRWMGNGG